ncbi:MAG: YbaK/EbsC family protein [Halodesulfurarchaeum sp.]
MDSKTERFRRKAVGAGASVEIRKLPQGTHSAADAADALGCPLSAIVKTIVFIVDEQPVIVYTAGVNQVDEQALAATLDAETLRLADPEEVEEHTGWSIGGVPPVGHGVDRCLVDPALREHERIWGGAGTPESVAAIDPEVLIELQNATPADVFE